MTDEKPSSALIRTVKIHPIRRWTFELMRPSIGVSIDFPPCHAKCWAWDLQSDTFSSCEVLRQAIEALRHHARKAHMSRDISLLERLSQGHQVPLGSAIPEILER